jgi:hypothetical protein
LGTRYRDSGQAATPRRKGGKILLSEANASKNAESNRGKIDPAWSKRNGASHA